MIAPRSKSSSSFTIILRSHLFHSVQCRSPDPKKRILLFINHARRICPYDILYSLKQMPI